MHNAQHIQLARRLGKYCVGQLRDKLFELGVAGLLATLVMIFANITFFSALLIFVLAFVAVSAGLEKFYKQKPSFHGLFSELIRNGERVSNRVEAKEWVVGVWTALNISGNSNLATEWDMDMSNVVTDETMSDEIAVTKSARGCLWLRAAIARIHAAAPLMAGRITDANRLALYNLYQTHIEGAKQISSHESAKTWAMKVGGLLRATGQSRPYFNDIIRSILRDQSENTTDYSLVVSEAVSALQVVAASFLPDQNASHTPTSPEKESLTR